MFSMAIFKAQKLFVCLIELKCAALSQEKVQFIFLFRLAAKTACCINPIVYAVSHPKFREAMARELPCFGIGAKPKENENKTMADSVKTESC